MTIIHVPFLCNRHHPDLYHIRHHHLIHYDARNEYNQMVVEIRRNHPCHSNILARKFRTHVTSLFQFLQDGLTGLLKYVKIGVM